MTLSELIVNQSTRVAELEAENERLHLINETLVKRCDELYKERDHLAARLKQCEEALRFYADCRNLELKPFGGGWLQTIKETGEVARTALTPAPASASEEVSDAE